MARKHKQKKEVATPLKGLTLAWFEVNVVHSAMKRTMETKPRGTYMPHWFDDLFKRVELCKKLNDHAIDYAEERRGEG